MALTNDDFKKIDAISAKHTEELAVIVAKGFDGVNNQFTEQHDYMDGRFEKIEETLEDHTDRLGRIETRQQVDQARLDNHDERISTLEKAV